ncbi:aminotransferase class IV [Thermospira aquatica]|uniref:Aminotransferase class IV n=1 Tax=Thermospira aquatica TaxID=2828656 RepID=A0AAX3BC01_9SPIR|nr:aminotransferase class IV [Thermospira aquatica]URA09656.1 aminotransferase class IV [Thermospira aquatica]
MYPFFETICLEKDGFHLLAYHQKRLNDVFLKFYPGEKPWELKKLLQPVPKVQTKTKCRFVYGKDGYQIFYEPYTLRRIEKVRILEKDISYPYKFTDRAEFEKYASLCKDGEMVVFSREGHITDSLVSNVVFFDGKHWITPTTYLLNGVKRQFYLEKHRILEKEITIQDMKSYTHIGFINAMIDLEELVLPITAVEVIHGLEEF